MRPETPETVTVIGGGWSAGSVAEPPVGVGLVIGVNDAAIYARCDIVVSMDRLWSEHRWNDICDRVEAGKMREAWLRRAALKNIVDRPPWLHPFDNDHEATVPVDIPGRLHGTNSGLCALNLAWTMRPKRILLVGFDMKRHPQTDAAYWYPPYPWSKGQGSTTSGKYKVWAAQFGPLAHACRTAGIEVFNCSKGSAIPSFPKASLKEFGGA